MSETNRVTKHLRVLGRFEIVLISVLSYAAIIEGAEKPTDWIRYE